MWGHILMNLNRKLCNYMRGIEDEGVLVRGDVYRDGGGLSVEGDGLRGGR